MSCGRAVVGAGSYLRPLARGRFALMAVWIRPLGDICNCLAFSGYGFSSLSSMRFACAKTLCGRNNILMLKGRR
jgi:hypothetical protein